MNSWTFWGLCWGVEDMVAKATMPVGKAKRPKHIRLGSLQWSLTLAKLSLLQLDRRALIFQGFLELLSIFLGEAFLDDLRRAFDQVLGFLEPETGRRAHF